MSCNCGRRDRLEAAQVVLPAPPAGEILLRSGEVNFIDICLRTGPRPKVALAREAGRRRLVGASSDPLAKQSIALLRPDVVSGSRASEQVHLQTILLGLDI
jgi:hypothetical protein